MAEDERHESEHHDTEHHETPKKSKSKTWWIIGGAAVAGGIIWYVMKSRASSTSAGSSIPSGTSTGSSNQQSGSQQGPNLAAQYNAYINNLLNSGIEPKVIALKGTAYRNFGISPQNPHDYIFGKYVNGQFNTSYEQPISQTHGAAATVGSTVGGYA